MVLQPLVVKTNRKSLRMIFKQKKLGIDSREVSLLEHVEVQDLHLFVYQVYQLSHLINY